VNGQLTANQLAGGGKPDDYGLVNQLGLSRENISDSLNDSLKRLDLACAGRAPMSPVRERFETDVEIPEVTKALDDVARSRVTRHFDMLSCSVWQFHVMQQVISDLPDNDWVS
jgi:aryl-alcohol dehydrogenase-like predicted oxidoreductase